MGKAFSRLLIVLFFIAPLVFSLFFLLRSSASLFQFQAESTFYSPYVIRASLISMSVALGSLIISMVIVYFCGYSLLFFRNSKIEKLISLFLSVPHLAYATGVLFLISSTGFLARLFVPIVGNEAGTFFGFDRDPNAISLTMALAFKESLFLLFVCLPKLYNSLYSHQAVSSRLLGHGFFTTWNYVYWPQLLESLRFPFWMILAYSMSVVDLSMVLGPTNPPTFSIVLWEFFQSPDKTKQLFSIIGSIHLVGLMFVAFLIWEGLMGFIKILRKFRIQWNVSSNFQLPGRTILATFVLVQLLPLILLMLWSVASEWTFPELFPSTFSLSNFSAGIVQIKDELFTSIELAVLSAVIAIAIVLVWFEWDERSLKPFTGYVVMLVPIFPALPLLFGFQIYVENLGLPPFLSVLLCHVFFVFPYIFILLKSYFLEFDNRYKYVSLSLGRTTLGFLLHVKIKMILPGIATALSVGFAVSLAQYLSTRMIGGGRIATLTTEMVVAVASESRKWMAVFGVLQTLLPLSVFILANSLTSKRAVNVEIKS